MTMWLLALLACDTQPTAPEASAAALTVLVTGGGEGEIEPCG